MNNDIAEVIAEINKVATLINLETEHDVFINISGHVKSIQVTVYLYGWTEGADPTFKDNWYFDKDSLKQTRGKGVLDSLRKLYKNRTINMESLSYSTIKVKQYHLYRR